MDMTGLELARLYYQQIGRKMLEEQFPEYLPRIAAGLVGEGSECFGFDDEISRDHDFGAGFCIWLAKEDYDKVGAKMQQCYDALPKEFMGFAARNTTARANQRVGVFEISDFYSRWIGSQQPPKDDMYWLYLPEHKIAAAVNGEVFEDNLGRFSAIRNSLKEYYPEDVRIKKIAARVAAMAQSGQYNYSRCMRRSDSVGASMALAEFIKNTLSLIYLLNRCYCPYYKWQFHGLKQMMAKQGNRFVLSRAVNMLEKLAKLPDQSDSWAQPCPDDFNPYLNELDRKVVVIENICMLVVYELKRQGLTDISDSFLDAHTDQIMQRIQGDLKRCHITEG